MVSFLIQVPGLAENRPSVLKGDWLYVRLHEGDSLSDKEYQGYVHDVRNEEVSLGFDKRFVQLFGSEIQDGHHGGHLETLFFINF